MRYLWILIFAVFFVFAAKLYVKPSDVYQADSPIEIHKEKIVRLAFVGDIMLDRDVENKILKEGAGEFKFPFLNIAEEIKSYDFAFGNLEGPISIRGRNVGSKYSFRMDPRVIEGLTFAGFDALSVANNHSGDWGYDAFADTLSILENAEIMPVGATGNPVYMEVEGLKLGLLGFSDFANPGARANEDVIKNGVSIAANNSDLVIASFHFGEEYQKMPSERQKMLAYLAADAGADLIIGHHPHVSQTLEKYRDSYIAYSLGNFIFDQYFSEDTMRGSLFEVNVKNGQILDAKLREVRLNEYYQPSLVD